MLNGAAEAVVPPHAVDGDGAVGVSVPGGEWDLPSSGALGSLHGFHLVETVWREDGLSTLRATGVSAS